MIFRQYEQVLNGTKTQTRRLRFPWELAVQLWKRGWSLQKPYAPYTWADWQDEIKEEHVAEANRILAEHHITLPIKPHRTAKANGRIHPISIGRERLQEISEEDAIAEGMFKELHPIALKPITRYMQLWDSINTKPGTRWQDDPETWVLTFELAQQA